MWDLVDIFLGGALIKTTPLGAVCYDDFDNYDAAQCSYLTTNWLNDSYIPYVYLSLHIRAHTPPS